MRPCDATKYLRQMFHKPSIVPFSSMLIIIITLSYLTPMGGGGMGCLQKPQELKMPVMSVPGSFPLYVLKRVEIS